MKIVNIVHAIDTEGPLYESLPATFSRLKEIYNITDISCSRENLEKLKKKQIKLNGLEEEVSVMLNSHLLNYNDTWKKIDKMLFKILDKSFREKFMDSFERGWIFNWHCVDHVGYKINPRKRDIGHHKIFDHYQKVLKNFEIDDDTINWHFHPMSTYREAHRNATSYLTSPEIFQILCRKIIDRKWFPNVFRAGFQTERPDSNWFLEQWIPFDLSNMSVENNEELYNKIDFKLGRSADWRLATKDWKVYHPHHDNYQMEGKCRRWIGRALNPLNRIAALDQHEINKAFARADQKLPTLLGLASHDFRDLSVEVEHIWSLINEAKKKFPDVQIKHCTSLEGFRNVIEINYKNVVPLELNISLEKKPLNDVPNLTIKTKKGKVFGPQPFLSILTNSGRYIHDNLDFSTDGKTWHYGFRNNTLLLSDIKKIGVAANDKVGNTFIKVLKLN